jgi:capsular exopolysaccharide synthesis family protein
MDPQSPNPSPEAPATLKLARTATGSAPAVVEPRRVLGLPAPPAPPALSATPDAMSLLRALKRRWFLAVALGCLAALLAGGAAWYLVPAKYLATSALRVDSRQQMGPERLLNAMAHQMLMKTSADRLKGKDILLKALKEDGVRSLGLIRKHPNTTAALMWMEENLKVEFREGSEVLNILLTGEEPQDLVRVVEALTNSFMNVINGDEKRQRRDRVLRYAKLLEEAKEKLREKGAEKEALTKAQGGKTAQTLAAEQTSNRYRLERAQENLFHHQYELDKKDNKLALAQEQKRKCELKQLSAPEIALEDIYKVDPDLKNDSAKVLKLETTVDYLRKSGHPRDDPFVRQYQAEAEAVRKKVEKRVAEVRTEIEAKMRKKYETDLDAVMVEMMTEMKPLQKHIEKYQKDVEALSKTAEEISLFSAKQNLIESEIVQQEKAVSDIFQAAKRAEVEDEGELPITRIGDAEWQPRDVKKRILMLLLAPFAALCGVVLAVAWWEFSARRIQGPDEVAAGLAIRVVGEVPELPDPRRLQRGADPQAQELYRHNLVESIDAIRTMLLRTAPTENLRTIMVTSAVGGEGKTTLASNLAMSLARAGRKTLLIDCDLRRPSAHQLFEQTLQPGFSEVVLREVELEGAVRPTTTDVNLYLLPAGHWDREVIQELAKSGITAIFEKLQADYDFIIVDSHPVLPATDSLLIAQHVDAVIVSLMRDVSQVHHVHTACQQLSTLGIRVFGAVVNGVPVKDYGKTYQYAPSTPAAA